MNNRLMVACAVGFVGIMSVIAEARLNTLTFTNASDQKVYVYYGHETKTAGQLANAVKVIQRGNGLSLKEYFINQPTYFFVSFDGPAEMRRTGYWFKVSEGKPVNVKVVEYAKKMSHESEFVAPMIVPTSRKLDESEIMLLNDDLQEVESVEDIRNRKNTYLWSGVRF